METDPAKPLLSPGPSAGHRALEIGHLRGSLRRRSVLGGVATGVGQMLNLLLQLVSTAVLGRLLLPGDFGLVQMFLAFAVIGMVLQELGLSDATVQAEELSHRQASNLFWLNTLIGGAFSTLGVVCTPLLVAFYDKPELGPIAWVLSLSLLLAGLSTQHLAVLRRQLRFGSVAGIQVAAQAVSVGLAIAAAVAGWGVWSLVVLHLAGTGTKTVLSWTLSGWLPGGVHRGVGTAPLVRFGLDVAVFNLVWNLTREADNMLIGRYRGDAALGLYTKAYGLLLLPLRQLNRPIGAVAVPMLARLQGQPEAFARYYLRAVQVVAYLSLPLVAVLGGLADEVIRLALGPGWEGAADIFRWLAVAGAVQTVQSTAGWVLQARGRGRELRNLGLWFAPVYLASFVAGLPYGAQGVAAAFATANVLTLLPTMWLGLRGSSISLAALGGRLVWPSVLGGLCLLSVLLGVPRLAPWFDRAADAVQTLGGPGGLALPEGLLEVTVGGPVAVVLAASLLWLFVPPVRRDLAEVSRLLGEALFRKRRSTPAPAADTYQPAERTASRDLSAPTNPDRPARP